MSDRSMQELVPTRTAKALGRARQRADNFLQRPLPRWVQLDLNQRPPEPHSDVSNTEKAGKLPVAQFMASYRFPELEQCP